MKRDAIFILAVVVALGGAGLFIAGSSAGLLLLAAAYLLRPALHECGIARGLADERQLLIHSRSGNIGFLVVILVTSGFALWRISRGESAEDLLQIIALGLAARALTNLVMIGEYRKAGAMILTAMGGFVAIFLIAEGGASVAGLVGLLLGAAIAGTGQVARRFPRTVAGILIGVIAAVAAFFHLYEFRAMQSALWLLFVMPLAVAVVCLLLGRNEDEDVSPGQRTMAFGGLAGAAVIVFVLLLTVGGRNVPVTRQMAAGPEGTVTEIQGIPCIGRVTYDASGKLQSCTLGRDHAFAGQPLAAGTVVHFTPDGVMDWCFLQENTMIQKHVCLGSGHDFMTGFHPNGKLKTAWLAQDEEIDGVPCAKFRFLSAWFGGGDCTTFHDNGRLRSCTLSARATVAGKDLPKNTKLEFDRDGNLITASR